MKFKRRWGLFVHVLIVFACLALFCFPYLGQTDIWLFLLFIGITHYIQDWAKIKFTSGSKYELLFFLLDQILHVLFISTIFLTDLQYTSAPNNSGSVLLSLYTNDPIVLYATAVIAASYMGHYMILLFKKDYLNKTEQVSPFEKRYGFLERILIVSTFFVETLWLLLIPVLLALRPLFARTMHNKLNISEHFASRTEIILSGAVAILTGLAFYMLI